MFVGFGSLLVALLMIRIWLVAFGLRRAYIWQHSLVRQSFSRFNGYLVVKHVNLFGVHFVQNRDHFGGQVLGVVLAVVSHKHLRWLRVWFFIDGLYVTFRSPQSVVIFTTPNFVLQDVPSEHSLQELFLDVFEVFNCSQLSLRHRFE